MTGVDRNGGLPGTADNGGTARPHVPVMLEQTLAALTPHPGGRYCDATLGAGGHALALLDRSAPDGRLIGVDRDPSALALAKETLAAHGDRVRLLHGRFGDLETLLGEAGELPLDGLLVDLGVSSMHLDRPERGFSFQRSGPVDMRMDPSSGGETALELIGRLDDDELADRIFRYGEERHSRRIARALKAAHDEGRLDDTLALARVIVDALPARERHPHGGAHPATRTFQALRIAVNDELGELERLLDVAPDLLAEGGRLAIIAFHSLEDRIVKDRLRELSTPPRDALTHATTGEAQLRLLHRKPQVASDEEVARNPRARSAKLRAAERTSARRS